MEIAGSGPWRVSGETLQPSVSVNWEWDGIQPNPATGSLSFRLPVKGLRWRVVASPDRVMPETPLPPGLDTWTRAPIRVARGDVTRLDLRLEVQTPDRDGLYVNDGRQETLPIGPEAGHRTRPIELNKIVRLDEDAIQLVWAGRSYPAVVFPDRPLLTSFDCYHPLVDNSPGFRADWTYALPSTGRVALLVWNPLRPAAEKRIIPLGPQTTAYRTTWRLLPDGSSSSEYLSVTLAEVQVGALGSKDFVSSGSFGRLPRHPVRRAARATRPAV